MASDPYLARALQDIRPANLQSRLDANQSAVNNPVDQVASFRNQKLGGILSGTAQGTGLSSDATGNVLFPGKKPNSAVQLGSQNTIVSIAEQNKRLAQANSIARQKAITQGRVQGYSNVGNIGKVGLASTYGGAMGNAANAIPSNMYYIRGGYLRKDAAFAFESMAQALKKATGANLQVTEGYRTYARQVYFWNLYKSGKGDPVAPPGHSTHNGGTAVDLRGYGSVGSAAWNWMLQNASRYGYVWTGGYQFKNQGLIEPWHWEYKG